MRQAVARGAVAFIVSFLLLSLATGFALQEGEKALSLFGRSGLEQSFNRRYARYDRGGSGSYSKRKTR